MALLTQSTSFTIVSAPETVAELSLHVYPALTPPDGYGRIVHPTLGAFDYEVKPDEWVNIDAEAIIQPIWASARTVTSTINTLWSGVLKDVVVEERWTAPGGIAMPVTQFRMLMTIWTNPIDPDVSYVQWHPNYITGVVYKVLPLSLTVGGQGIALDDVTNYKDWDTGAPIGWVTGQVVFQMKIVEAV